MLESHGYRGWYVMEWDIILTGVGGGDGPAADVRTSVTHLRNLSR